MILLLRFTFVFFFGGLVYQVLELSWRKYTHISMFFAGAISFTAINLLHMFLWESHPIATILLSGLAITVVEFIVGYIVNIKMKLKVWDYSKNKFNFKGQVCLLFTFLWTLLSIPAIYISGIIANLTSIA